MSRLASYTIGFFAALLLTSVAFTLGFLHVGGHISSMVVIPAIMVLAFIQLMVQLYFFLHLGPQKEARWDTVMFGITFATILLVTVAISWIMTHLNYNMTPESMRQYIDNQSSF